MYPCQSILDLGTYEEVCRCKIQASGRPLEILVSLSDIPHEPVGFTSVLNVVEVHVQVHPCLSILNLGKQEVGGRCQIQAVGQVLEPLDPLFGSPHQPEEPTLQEKWKGIITVQTFSLVPGSKAF